MLLGTAGDWKPSPDSPTGSERGSAARQAPWCVELGSRQRRAACKPPTDMLCDRFRQTRVERLKGRVCFFVTCCAHGVCGDAANCRFQRDTRLRGVARSVSQKGTAGHSSSWRRALVRRGDSGTLVFVALRSVGRRGQVRVSASVCSQKASSGRKTDQSPTIRLRGVAIRVSALSQGRRMKNGGDPIGRPRRGDRWLSVRSASERHDRVHGGRELTAAGKRVEGKLVGRIPSIRRTSPSGPRGGRPSSDWDGSSARGSDR